MIWVCSLSSFWQSNIRSFILVDLSLFILSWSCFHLKWCIELISPLFYLFFLLCLNRVLKVLCNSPVVSINYNVGAFTLDWRVLLRWAAIRRILDLTIVPPLYLFWSVLDTSLWYHICASGILICVCDSAFIIIICGHSRARNDGNIIKGIPSNHASLGTCKHLSLASTLV